MSLVRSYFKILVGCITEPKTYLELLGKSKRSAIFFYIITFFFVSIVSVIVWRVRDFPVAINTVRQATNALVAQIPENAKFSFDSKVLTTENVVLPLGLYDTRDGVAYTLTFEKDKLSISPDGSSPVSQAYADLDVSPFTATKVQIADFVSSALSSIETNIQRTLVFAFPMIWTGKIIVGMITLLFYTLFGQILGWLLGVMIQYKKLYKLGLYILPISALVDTIAHGLFGGDVSLTLVGYIGIIILVLLDVKKYGTRKP